MTLAITGSNGSTQIILSEGEDILNNPDAHIGDINGFTIRTTSQKSRAENEALTSLARCTKELKPELLNSEDLFFLVMAAYRSARRKHIKVPPLIATHSGGTQYDVPRPQRILAVNIAGAYLSHIPFKCSPAGIPQLYKYILQGKDDEWCLQETGIHLRQEDDALDLLIERDMMRTIIPLETFTSWTSRRYFPHAYQHKL